MSPVERGVLFEQLTRHGEVLEAMLSGLPADQQRWKPEPAKWCALEVICHLHDEEREDFRARLRSTLEDPAAPWPKIDPAAWVAERKYIEQDFAAKLHGFVEERKRSVEWLRSMDNASWVHAYIHPKVGPVSCGLLLTNWVAHDLHHMRQLINLRYTYVKANTKVPLDYAGTW